MTVAVILATGRAEGPSGAPGGAARLRAGLATVNVPDVIVIGRPGAGTAPGSPAIRVQPGSGTHPAASAVSAAPARKDGPRAARLARRLNGRRGLYWFKKILALPIGERFALIALTAALFDPRVTFLALLVWGSIAAAYTPDRAAGQNEDRMTEGMSASERLQAYRDDGPVSLMLGRLAGGTFA